MFKKKLIRFRRLNKSGSYGHNITAKSAEGKYNILISFWEIAFNIDHLHYKLNGEMAEIIMPAKPLIIRIWRYFFPLRGLEMKAESGQNK